MLTSPVWQQPFLLFPCLCSYTHTFVCPLVFRSALFCPSPFHLELPQSLPFAVGCFDPCGVYSGLVRIKPSTHCGDCTAEFHECLCKIEEGQDPSTMGAQLSCDVNEIIAANPDYPPRLIPVHARLKLPKDCNCEDVKECICPAPSPETIPEESPQNSDELNPWKINYYIAIPSATLLLLGVATYWAYKDRQRRGRENAGGGAGGEAGEAGNAAACHDNAAQEPARQHCWGANNPQVIICWSMYGCVNVNAPASNELEMV